MLQIGLRVYNKSRWRPAVILKQIDNSPYLGNGLTDHNKIWHVNANCPSETHRPLKFRTFKKSKLAEGCHFENRKTLYFSNGVYRIFLVLLFLLQHFQRYSGLSGVNMELTAAHCSGLLPIQTTVTARYRLSTWDHVARRAQRNSLSVAFIQMDIYRKQTEAALSKKLSRRTERPRATYKTTQRSHAAVRRRVMFKTAIVNNYVE